MVNILIRLILISTFCGILYTVWGQADDVIEVTRKIIGGM